MPSLNPKFYPRRSIMVLTLVLAWGSMFPVVSLAAPSFGAAMAAPKMQVRAGFDGYYKQFSWLPVQFNLSLPEGQPNFEGWIEASFGNFQDDTVRYRRSIQLAAPANRTTWLYLATDNRNLGEVQVRLTSREGAELARETIGIRVLNQSDLLVGVISDDSSALNYLNGERLSQAFNRGSALFQMRYNNRANNVVRPGIRIAHLTPGDLPGEGTGWDSLDGLAISDLSTFNLGDQSLNQPDMLDAAAGWLAQGRFLFAAGDSSLRRSGFLFDLLPVKAASSPQNRAFPASLRQLASEAVTPANLLVADVVSLPGSSVALAQDGKPLLVKRDFGLGVSWYLAAEFRSLPAPINTGVWGTALNNHEPHLSIISSHRQPSEPYRPWSNQVNPNTHQAILPEGWIVTLALAVYILLLGPVTYFVLKSAGKTELGWVVVPVLALGAGIGFYVVGTVTNGEPLVISRLAVLTVGETAGARLAGGTSHLVTIYSNSRVDFQLNVNDQSLSSPLSRYRTSVVRGAISENTANAISEIQQGPGGGYGQIVLGLTDQRSFTVEQDGIKQLGEGLFARLRAKGDELEGTLENRTGKDWQDLGLWKPGGRVYRIPLIKAGEKLTLSAVYIVRQVMPLSEMLAGLEPPGFDDRLNSTRVYQEHKEVVLSTVVGKNGEVLSKDTNRAYLVAWQQATTDFPLKIQNHPVTAVDLTLMFQPLNLQ